MHVVPLVGTWIEIYPAGAGKGSSGVVPLVGTWIEIFVGEIGTKVFKSFPSWERGLKFLQHTKMETLQTSFPSWERGLKLKK